MLLESKYRPVLELGEKYDARNMQAKEEDGKLRMGGTVSTQYEKDRMWDKIKEIGGEDPWDIEADIKVANTAYYHKHTVEKGESLSEIANKYYGDPMQYMRIFNANKDVLEDPNMIYPDQELVIPFPEGRL